MKKLLSVLLAALILFGVFAIGANAMSIEEFLPAAAENSAILAIAETPAPVFAEDAGDEFAKKFPDIFMEAKKPANEKFEASDAFNVLFLLADREKAYQPGKTAEQLDDAIDAAVADTAAVKELNAFLADEAALKAAYADGTLKDKLIAMNIAVTDVRIAAIERLLPDYLLADALTYAKEATKLLNLAAKLEDAGLSEAQYITVMVQLMDVFSSKRTEQLTNALNDGNYKEAAKIARYATTKCERVFARYGIVEAPSFWAKLWNFILKWFLFGWIWMK